MAPKWTKQRGVITGREAERRAKGAHRKADFRAAKKGDRSAAARIIKRLRGS